MKAYTYIEKGHFALIEKPKPELQEPTDAIVRVTLLHKRPSHQARKRAKSCFWHYRWT